MIDEYEYEIYYMHTQYFADDTRNNVLKNIFNKVLNANFTRNECKQDRDGLRNIRIFRLSGCYALASDQQI